MVLLTTDPRLYITTSLGLIYFIAESLLYNPPDDIFKCCLHAFLSGMDYYTKGYYCCATWRNWKCLTHEEGFFFFF